MSDLSVYLDSEFKGIRERIAEIEGLLSGVAELLRVSRGKNPPVWPYEWHEKATQRDDSGGYSVSTQAMCCTAVENLLKADRLHRFLTDELRKSLTTLVTETQARVLKDLNTNIAADKPAWSSSTYLGEDVFTAAWLVELNRVSRGTDRENDLGWTLELKTRLVKVISDALIEKQNEEINGKTVIVNQRPFVDRSLFPANAENEASAHPLPLLRAIQAILWIKGHPKTADSWPADEVLEQSVLDQAGRWFEHNLNRQMSFYHFKDFRFDAAELIFCLAGALQSGSIWQTEPILDNVLLIVRGAQERSVYWRPYRPMLSNPKGQVLLPLSIEVATALVRTLALLQRFHGFKDTLEKYYQWGFSQRIIFQNCTGWHSENAYETRKVHVWDSALVGSFLVDFRDALETEMKVELLKRFNVRPIRTSDPSLTQLLPVAFDLGLKKKIVVEKTALEAVREQLVLPHTSQQGKRIYSLLLYGPPGVSKTTLATAIAKELRETDPDWEFVYLSPSDFISGGEAGIEERAKGIFKALSALRKCVIFFDEIDRLILDRESSAYGAQGDMFQFMTPSMLTKLNDLRKEEKSVFIIATNFSERIDPAIKREGRIDQPILVLPYDLESRAEQIRKLIDQEIKTEEPWDASVAERIVVPAKEMPLYVYEELKRAVRTASEGASRASVAQFRIEVVKNLSERKSFPSAQISIDSYVERAEAERSADRPYYPQKPFEETLRLLLISGESRPSDARRAQFGRVRQKWAKADADGYAVSEPVINMYAEAYGLDSWLKGK